MNERRRTTDQNFWRRLYETVREQPVVALLVFCVVGILIIALILQFVLAPRASHNEQLIAANQQELSSSTLHQCQRGNTTRPQTIQTDLDIAQGNRDRAAAWGQIVKDFPPWPTSPPSSGQPTSEKPGA